MTKWTEKEINKALGYRTSKLITSHYTYEDSTYGTLMFELCPTCDSAIERTYQKYCSECGQKLNWSKVSAMNRTQEKSEIDLMMRMAESESYGFRNIIVKEVREPLPYVAHLEEKNSTFQLLRIRRGVRWNTYNAYSQVTKKVMT